MCKLFSKVGAFAFVFLVLLFFSENSLTNGFNWTICQGLDPIRCKCTSEILNDVTARCQLNHVTDLMVIAMNPPDVVRLNLSENNIQSIPNVSFSNFSQLIYLSLSSNKIHFISEGAFKGLTRLRELNLQDNLIHHWDTTLIHHDLPNLIMLNIAQNMYWKPDQQILSLPNLKVILLLVAFIPREQGKVCSYFQCHLVRRHLEMSTINYSFIQDIPGSFQQKVEPDFLLKLPDRCRYSKLFFVDGKYWDFIDGNGFYFHCEMSAQPMCFLSNTNKNSTQSNQQKEWFYLENNIYCWSTTQRIHIITLFEGICAMVFNLIVILTTLRSKVLRDSVAHVLVANIAAGDLFISCYMIIIASTRMSLSSIEFSDLYKPHFCRIVGFFFLVGQFSSPVMSFIMTLERYLAVVYCMRPHIRITRTMCYVAMVTIWGLSVSLAVSFMTSPKFSLKTDDMCVPLENSDNTQLLYYAGGVGVVLYILSIALYVHMYLDFQKTNQKTVQLQRENRLARRVSLIMFTNVFFFIIPLVVIIITNNQMTIGTSYTFRKTFGISCLGINSCINPILFSFRNDVFRSEFRKHFCLCHRGSVAAQS